MHPLVTAKVVEVAEDGVDLQREVARLDEAEIELWQLLITESDWSAPEEQEPELGGVAGVAEEEVERVEIPGVELDMDRPAAHHSNKVAQEERQQERVDTSGRRRY